MANEATIEGGFAQVQAGTWLMGTAQPVAYQGRVIERRIKGWIVPDRARLQQLEVVGTASCSDATRPFLTRLDCADALFVNSERILVAPEAARAPWAFPQTQNRIPRSPSRCRRGSWDATGSFRPNHR